MCSQDRANVLYLQQNIKANRVGCLSESRVGLKDLSSDHMCAADGWKEGRKEGQDLIRSYHWHQGWMRLCPESSREYPLLCLDHHCLDHHSVSHRSGVLSKSE